MKRPKNNEKEAGVGPFKKIKFVYDIGPLRGRDWRVFFYCGDYINFLSVLKKYNYTFKIKNDKMFVSSAQSNLQ